jgi:hypothetical protein
MGERPAGRLAGLSFSRNPTEPMSTKKKAKGPAEETPEVEAAAAEPSKPAEAGAPPEEYNPARLITPQEACSYYTPCDS